MFQMVSPSGSRGKRPFPNRYAKKPFGSGVAAEGKGQHLTEFSRGTVQYLEIGMIGRLREFPGKNLPTVGCHIAIQAWLR